MGGEIAGEPWVGGVDFADRSLVMGWHYAIVVLLWCYCEKKERITPAKVAKGESLTICSIVQYVLHEVKQSASELPPLKSRSSG